MLKHIKTSNTSIYKRVKLYWLQALWRSNNITQYKKFHMNLLTACIVIEDMQKK